MSLLCPGGADEEVRRPAAVDVWPGAGVRVGVVPEVEELDRRWLGVVGPAQPNFVAFGRRSARAHRAKNPERKARVPLEHPALCVRQRECSVEVLFEQHSVELGCHRGQPWMNCSMSRSSTSWPWAAKLSNVALRFVWTTPPNESW